MWSRERVVAAALRTKRRAERSQAAPITASLIRERVDPPVPVGEPWSESRGHSPVSVCLLQAGVVLLVLHVVAARPGYAPIAVHNNVDYYVSQLANQYCLSYVPTIVVIVAKQCLRY